MNDRDDWTALVSAEALAAALDRPGLAIVDARFSLSDPGAGAAAHRAAHLPGAGYAHLDRDLSDLSKPAASGRHPLPEPAVFAAALARLGIAPDTQVVVYDAGDGAMAAARLWWLLRIAGHRRVAVLDGGFARWQALDLPVESADVADRGLPVRAVEFDETQIVGTDEVQARLGDAPGWLLDARAPERFRGEVEPLDPVAGHIPGARNRPYVDTLRDGRFRPPAELRASFEALLEGTPPARVVLQCGSGVTAAHLLLAMEHAGLPGARVYAPSWSGWVSDPARPVATGG